MYTLLVIAAMIAIQTTLSAQSSMVIFKGKITDEKTGAPVEVEMKIEGKKKYEPKVNSKSGEYSQALFSGETYKVSIRAYNVFKYVENVDIASAPKMMDIIKNFKVKTIVQGEVIQEGAMFNYGTAELTSEAKQKLVELTELMKNNRDLNIVIAISNDQAPKVETKTTVKPAPKGKKKQTPVVAAAEPVAEQSTAIADTYNARIDAIKQALSEVKNAEIRIVYQNAGIAPKGNANLRIVVGEVKNQME